MLQDQKKTNLYLNRINHILDYIEQNLEKDLSLEKLSQIVHTSPFHFHRIFSLTCGETPYQLVLRKRLEKAASTIMKERRRLISEISMQYGFDNAASFSRAFKRHYHFSASSLQADPVVNSIGSYEKKARIAKRTLPSRGIFVTVRL
ncbi:MAG: AraC family transcriptional regulator [Saprospiraceae bacterium]|nr:AraC family transcriptional regulator [Saprospiraceae bacterium]